MTFENPRPRDMKTSDLIMELVSTAVVMADQATFSVGRNATDLERRDAVAKEIDARVKIRG